LASLQLTDESSYRCEITYEETGRWFKDSCLNSQTTQLTVYGKPTFVTVNLENGTKIDHRGVIGPYTEDTLLVLKCKSGGGKPIPEVTFSYKSDHCWHEPLFNRPEK